jgi:beta-lactamase regulating signal transducer with metallopeptidase domain
MKTVAFLIFVVAIIVLLFVVFLRKSDTPNTKSNQSQVTQQPKVTQQTQTASQEPKSAFEQLASIIKGTGIFLFVLSILFALLALMFYASIEDCSTYTYTYEQAECIIQNSNKQVAKDALLQLSTVLFFVGTPLWYCGSKIAKIKE